jgi:hypothetical protein
MIVTSVSGGLRLITQTDHAAFAAELLKLWFRDGLPAHPRRRELLFAAREHDNGWRETDSAPFCDQQSGRPHDFLSLPQAERVRIWQRGPLRYVEREPYAALLIVRHAINLHREHQGDDAWAELVASWKALEARLKEELAMDEETVAADYRWIDVSDTLSLVGCGALQESVVDRGVSMQRRGGELVVDPFPLAGATTFRVSCREIPDRRYRSDVDLAVELASARWGELAVRVVAE